MYTVVYFIFIVYFSVVQCMQQPDLQTNHRNNESQFPIINNFNSIMEIFEEEKERFPELVNEILNTYYNSCLFAPDAEIPESNRRPFIVLEGNNKDRRELVGRLLADSIGARLLLIPPKCLAKYVTKIEPATKLRRAFFALSLYVAAYNVRQLWSLDTPVIMNGYWTGQTAFIINKNFPNINSLPPEEDDIYNPPADLMPPDMIFYIQFPLTTKSSFQFSYNPHKRPLMWYIFSRFKNPKPFLINSAIRERGLATQLRQYINRHLSHKCILSFTLPNNIDKI